MRSIGRWFGSLAGLLMFIAANSVAAQPVDAASKGYVDTSGAATRAYANALAVSSIPLTAYSAAVSGGSAPPDQWGCPMLLSNASLRLDLPAPVGANIVGIQVKYLMFNTDALMTFQVMKVAFGPGGAGDHLEAAFSGFNS